MLSVTTLLFLHHAMFVFSLKMTKEDECSVTSGRRIVLVNLNKEYIESGMFFNWYHYAQDHLASSQLVIDASSDAVRMLLPIKELPDEIFVVDVNGGMNTLGLLRKGGVSFSKAPFGSRGFRDLMKHRVEQISFLLKQGCTVLQVDVDTVWKQNVFHDIDAAGRHALILTDDDASKNRWPHKWYLCGCFLHMSPSLAQGSFLEDWQKETSRQNGNEQIALNNVLRKSYAHNPIDFAVLPLDHYMPGPITSAHAHVIHANWIVGIKRKVAFLKKKNVWHESTDQWLRSRR